MPNARRPKRASDKPEARGAESAAHYLIQVELEKRPAGLRVLQKLLEPYGVELDPSYGPILIDPERHRYVVRGRATPGARREVESTIPGVQFFGDPRIGPAVPDG